MHGYRRCRKLGYTHVIWYRSRVGCNRPRTGPKQSARPGTLHRHQPGIAIGREATVAILHHATHYRSWQACATTWPTQLGRRPAGTARSIPGWAVLCSPSARRVTQQPEGSNLRREQNRCSRTCRQATADQIARPSAPTRVPATAWPTVRPVCWPTAWPTARPSAWPTDGRGLPQGETSPSQALSACPQLGSPAAATVTSRRECVDARMPAGQR
jgi:hypothetical protein